MTTSRRASRLTRLLLGLLVLLAAGGTALAQGKVDLGKREYEANCAACHGLTGRGDGVLKSSLTRAPTDLSTLARANGGVLPVARMLEVIDGSREVAAHGTREMPAWGPEYRLRAAEYYVDVPYNPEAWVRGRLLLLVDYINRLQAK